MNRKIAQSIFDESLPIPLSNYIHNREKGILLAFVSLSETTKHPEQNTDGINKHVSDS